MLIPHHDATEASSPVDVSLLPEVVVEDSIRQARDLALELHAGQWYDQHCGITYFDGHLQPVAEIGEHLCRITGESRLAVASLWLHDSVEDVEGITLAYLHGRRVVTPVLQDVDLMTRRHNEKRRDYLHRVSSTRRSAMEKLADSTGNVRNNLEFHDHWPGWISRKRIMKYPANIAHLAPLVFGEEIALDDETRAAAEDPETAFDRLVGALCNLRDAVAFDDNAADAEVKRRLLTYPQQVAFLAPVVLGETVDTTMIDEIAAAVRR